MSRHGCPAPWCAVSVDDAMFACRSDWYRLPADIRNRIWSAFNRHGVGSVELRRAHADAMQWYRERGQQRSGGQHA